MVELFRSVADGCVCVRPRYGGQVRSRHDAQHPGPIPHYDLVCAADSPAADRATGPLALAFPPSPALRERGRTAEPRSAEPLAGDPRPDLSLGLQADGAGRGDREI